MKILKDNLNRRITYLRVSVTTDCNLQCFYCATGGKPVNSLLSFNEITKVVSAASKIGISKIRITGGEPLLRKNLPELVKRVSQIKEINDISITTNGHLLPQLSPGLKSAGLNRLNISLDSLNPETYKKINGGNLENVLKGISSAKKYFDDIRINMVVLRDVNDNEADNFIKFGKENDLTVRFLELMPNKGQSTNSPFLKGTRGISYHCNQQPPPSRECPDLLGRGMFLSNEILISKLQKKYKFTRLSNNEKNGSAEWFSVDNSSQKIGFISPMGKPFCSDCNRMRLTAFGELIPCLHGEERISLCEVLHADNYEKAITEKFHFAARQKITKHQLDKGKTSCEMKVIGG